ncbi:hypothetical protein Patl1_23794 [Pistacia atlantica]|uniref:Uncharacterized protein n=1 Tax=Pistacia atlantica TaxID=434234 RepID=A0ACC0ZWK1_9ROSI|nr:hypothetical protein Patl1_23794 [Pistacia atlantica]
MQVDEMEVKLNVSMVKLVERTKAVVVKEKEFKDDYRVELEKFKARAFRGGGLAKKVFKVSPNLEDTLASSPLL